MTSFAEVDRQVYAVGCGGDNPTRYRRQQGCLDVQWTASRGGFLGIPTPQVEDIGSCEVD